MVSKHKYCLVRNCSNNSVKSKKLFVRIPVDLKLKENWFKAIDVSPSRSKSTTFQFCCEDHFDLQNDAENFLEFQMTGARLRMKKTIVPHLNLDINHINEEATQLTISGIKPSLPKKKKVASEPACSSSLSGKCDISSTKILTSMYSSPISFPCTCSTAFSSNILSDASSSVDLIVRNDQEDGSNKIDKVVYLENLQTRSRFFLGLPDSEYFVLKLLVNHVKKDYTHILITLKKIKVNDPYCRLAAEFGISESMIANIFLSSISIIADTMREFIIWPDKKTILLNVPYQFLPRYKKVQSIIDCLELEIQTPNNVIYQALTWNEYKKCNTAKYLISCTPFGLINYISPGYGGRASDKEILEQSDYLKYLPDNCEVIADRGYKNIESLLHKKKCQLLRPPLMSLHQKMTAEEAKISSMRLHVERVIRRIREFNILSANALVQNSLIHLLDEIIIIVCGIISTQGSLIL